MPIYKTNTKKDGKYRYEVKLNYTDTLGNYKQLKRSVYGLNEAKMLEMKLLSEIDSGSTHQNITLADLFAEYSNTKQHELRETSFEKAKRISQKYIIDTLGNYKLDKLTIPILNKWKNEIAKLPLAPATKRNIYGQFRALLNYAVKMQYVPTNNLAVIGNFKTAQFDIVQEKIHYYTQEQFTAYMDVAKNKIKTDFDWCFYVFFAVAYYTGMRKGEINALKWSDIKGNIIHVRRSVAQKLKGADRETLPKSKKSYRDLQMPFPLVSILEEHKLRQQQIPQWSEDFRVCGGIKCLRDTTIAKKNIEFAKAAGLPVIRIHDFRHSHASLLTNNGINIQEIARRLGHSNVEITWNTYSHLYPKEEERAVSVLNKITL